MDRQLSNPHTELIFAQSQESRCFLSPQPSSPCIHPLGLARTDCSSDCCLPAASDHSALSPLAGWSVSPVWAVCGGMCGVASPALCSPRTGCSNLVMLLHCSRRSALQRNVPANLIVDTDSADLQISKFLSWPRIMTGGFYANFLAPSMRRLLGLHKQPPTKICNLVSC